MTARRALGGVLLAAWVALALPQLLASAQPAVALPALAALGAALVVCAALPPVARGLARALAAPPAWAFVLAAGAVAAALSYAVVAGPMDHVVLSRDGCVYLLEARALSHGHFGMPIPPPRLPFSVHFVFEGPDGRLYGVFPPGYPLFLVPFVWLGAPLAAGPVTAALLVLALHRLARAVARDELAARVAVLLSLPSFARAVETADLLSHAFVAALAALAVALALELRARPGLARAALAGACVGWAFAARLLDGLVLGLVVAAVLAHGAWRRAIPPKLLAVALAAAVPFVVLVAAQQRAATGSWTTPTQTEYFVRSDYPPTCHRLGLGRDVGCAVEHTLERNTFGPDGYTLDDAARVARERAGVLGGDLFGYGPLVLLAFAAAVARPDGARLVAAGLAVALALAYGLFYYGNAPIYGARHLFPAGPFLWALAGACVAGLPHRRAAGAGAWLDAGHVRGAAAAALVAAGVVAGRGAWTTGYALTRGVIAPRVEVRDAIARGRVARGIVVTRDVGGFLAAYDPWLDAPSRYVVHDDRSGLHELRLLRPSLPVYATGPRDEIHEVPLGVPFPGVLIELERAWPAFQRPVGAGAVPVHTPSCCNLPASGEHVLFVFAAAPGATVTIPVYVARAGRYALRVEGLVAPDYGDWDLALDGLPLGRWSGYAPRQGVRRGAPAPPRQVAAGRHVFTARCVGKDPRSAGYLVSLDALVGAPAP